MSSKGPTFPRVSWVLERLQLPMEHIGLLENGQIAVDNFRSAMLEQSIDTRQLSDLDISILMGWTRANFSHDEMAKAVLGLMVIATPGHPAYDEARSGFAKVYQQTLMSAPGGKSASNDPSQPVWKARRKGRKGTTKGDV